MYRGVSAWFKVVQKDEDEYAVWHSEAEVLTEWKETGRYGTIDACWDYIEANEGTQGFLFRFDDAW